MLPVMAVATLAGIYVAARRTGDILVSTVVTGAAWIAMAGSLSIRPQVLSFGFAAVTASAWLQSATDLRPRWWLVPLTWVWACWHGMWTTGLAIALVVVVALMWSHRHNLDTIRPLMVVGGLCILASALTPAGPALWQAPIEVAGVAGFLEEWQRPSVFSVPTAAAGIMLVTPLILALSRQWRPTFVELALMALAAVLVVTSARTVGLGAATVAPVLASALQGLLPEPRRGHSRGQVVTLALGSALGLAAAALLAPSAAAGQTGMPVALDAHISQLPTSTVVCADAQASSWLLWSHPDVAPVVDGRFELYRPQDLEAYLAFEAGGPPTVEFAARHACTAALLRRDSPAERALSSDRAWHTIAARDGWVLLGVAP